MGKSVCRTHILLGFSPQYIRILGLKAKIMRSTCSTLQLLRKLYQAILTLISIEFSLIIYAPPVSAAPAISP